MKQVLEEGMKRIKMRDKALEEVQTLNKQLYEASEALREDKETLTGLQNHFKEEDDERNHSSVKQQIEYKDRLFTALSQKSDAKSQHEQDLEEYDDEQILNSAFIKVKQLTGIDNADEIVQQLNQLEELNFSRFNYITQELEAESEALEHQIAEAQRELEMRRCSVLTADTQKREMAIVMKGKRIELEEKIKEVDAQYQRKLADWEKIKASIQIACHELDLSM
jgi:hypothetical protein